jgi:pimeloyl-ACP methyl ester carboxylesterase
MNMSARPLLTAFMLASMFTALPALAQGSAAVYRTPGDSAQDAYRIHPAGIRPIGLLVLLPGFGGDINSFAADGFTPSELPERLSPVGVTTIVAVPHAETLYMDEEALRRLDEIIAEIREGEGIPDRVVVGGFSAGGTGAVRYAQRCAVMQCQGTKGVAGVFTVDAPLDFERLYRGEMTSLARGGPLTNTSEARMIVEAFHRELGGSPDQEPDEYRRRSPLLASSPEGGNARLLRGIAFRAYTEPDVHWWIENRNIDYGMMNSVDAAAVVNLLRIAGNARAELITTSGEGRRPDGTRHPHSWSIVDEDELSGWITALAAEPPAPESPR